MITAVMQPYFFPYIGYYQLMSVVDNFVILDDVNFIMKGWINRNSILLNKKSYMFSLMLSKPSQNKLIKETELNFPETLRLKLLKTFEMAYKKAPYYNDFSPILQNIIINDKKDLTSYIKYSLEEICKYIGIKPKIFLSSRIEKDNSLKAQDRIIELCKKTNTKTYINLSGGKELYNAKDFLDNGIHLKFIKAKTDQIVYKQYANDFVPNLSIIDVIMFNSKEEITQLLKLYDLEEADG